MKERPILFSGPMVRALLDGTKTQTRRVCKPAATLSAVVEVPDPLERGQVYNGSHFGDEDGEAQFACPYGGRGERLWVRETHYLHGIWSVRKDDDGKRRWTFSPNQDMGVQFYEPNGLIRGRSTTVPGWYRRPSIHMPRWASRITLEITSVRVERLQDISEADALAEGIVRQPDGGYGLADTTHYHFTDPHQSYFSLWEAINGAGSVEDNPWVWVVEFRSVEVAAK